MVTAARPQPGEPGSWANKLLNYLTQLDITEAASEARTFLAGAFLRRDVDTSLADGVDVTLGTGVGTRIGTGPGEKLGLYGATPVARATALTAAPAAAPAGGVGAAAGAWDTAANRDAAIATINTTATRVAELEARLRALGVLP